MIYISTFLFLPSFCPIWKTSTTCERVEGKQSNKGTKEEKGFSPSRFFFLQNLRYGMKLQKVSVRKKKNNFLDRVPLERIKEKQLKKATEEGGEGNSFPEFPPSRIFFKKNLRYEVKRWKFPGNSSYKGEKRKKKFFGRGLVKGGKEKQLTKATEERRGCFLGFLLLQNIF